MPVTESQNFESLDELKDKVAEKLGRMTDRITDDLALSRFRMWVLSLPTPDHVVEFPLAPLRRRRVRRIVLPTIYLRA